MLLRLPENPTPEQCYNYAILHNKCLEKKYEEIIKKDAFYAYWYAKNVIKDRWKEAEDIIKKYPQFAYSYARYVIEGRWKEAEKYIKKDPYWDYWYARHVIKANTYCCR